MAIGRLAASKPAADTNTLLYSAPSGQHATATLSIGRQGDGSELVRVAHIDSTNVGDLADEDYLEYDSNVVEITGIVIGSGESIVVRTDANTVSFVLYGFEEAN